MDDLFRNETTRRGFLGAAATAIVSALVIGVLWLVSRRAPSAGTDPAFVSPLEAPATAPGGTP